MKRLVLHCVSEVSSRLTKVAGLAGQGVELLLVGPLLIVGGRDDEEAPPPAKPATVETVAEDLSLYANMFPYRFCQR